MDRRRVKVLLVFLLVWVPLVVLALWKQNTMFFAALWFPAMALLLWITRRR